MTHEEARVAPGSNASDSTLASPADPVYPAKIARWLELAEFALDNEPERIDALVELCELLESAWIDATTVTS